ncbi:MAG: hypothetical protein STSR0009_22160 [Methanoregula sp.]
MENTTAWSYLPGTTPKEKCASLGIVRGRIIDVRELDEKSRKYGIDIFLFFEKDLVRTQTLEQVQEQYKAVPEFERPYVRVDRFLAFTQENDPSFEQTLRDFPLMIEIVATGETQPAPGSDPVPFVTGLMPFLDELDVDAEPPQVNVPQPL